MCDEEEEEERKKEEKFSCSAFLSLRKVSRTYRVDLAIEQQKDVVCKLLAFLCFVFHGAAPVPYVQAAILNLLHQYLRSTTAQAAEDDFEHGGKENCILSMGAKKIAF